MYATAFGRPPTKDELTAATEFLVEQSKEYGKPTTQRHGPTSHTSSSTQKEFIFVE